MWAGMGIEEFMVACYIWIFKGGKFKIWVQQNMTEMRIAQKLVDLGVPKQDIVLGFQPPEIRQYTESSVV